MSMEMLLVFVAVGSLSAFLSGMLGFGGAAFLVPLFLVTLPYFMKVDHASIVSFSIGTSYAIMALTAPIGLMIHHKWEAVEWSAVKKTLPFLVIGTSLGLVVVFMLGALLQKIFFGAYLLFAGMFMMSKGHLDHPVEFEVPDSKMRGLGSLSSFLAGLSGMNGQVLILPLLSVMKMQLGRAIATAFAMSLPIAFIGAAGYVIYGLMATKGVQPVGSFGYMFFPAVLGAGIPGLVMAPLGAHFGHKMPRKLLHFLVSFVLILLGVSIITYSLI